MKETTIFKFNKTLIDTSPIILLILALLALVQVAKAQESIDEHHDRQLLSNELLQEVEKYGEIPVIVSLEIPVYEAWQVEQISQAQLDMFMLEEAMAEIAATGDRVIDRLAGQNIKQVKRYEYLPLLAMIVDENALEMLARDKSVSGINIDIPVPPAMDETIPLIQANNTHFLNYRGSGWSIAILDTGVDKNHPSIFGKVISEACYSSNVPSHGAVSLCPGGATSSTANNSALACAAGISGCDHGTHVADIAARTAPGSWLIPIQVFSRFTDSGSITFCQNANRTSPCTLSYTSDQISALNRVWGLHIAGNNLNVAAANMSLGSGQYASFCDSESAFDGIRLAINQLRNNNVATVIAAGNSGFRSAMASPACLSSAISVAASTKTDQVASFSNISSLTTLIAPGTPILAAVPQTFSPIYQTRGGTSMAAPHVAGVIATLKEAQPNATVTQVITALTSGGPNITDLRSGGSVTKRRLSAWTSMCNIINCDSDDFRTISTGQTLNGFISPAGDVDHYYFFGTAGQRLTLRMDRTSGSIDPYLELFSPSGFRVAFNDNGGGGVNALINGYLLPQNGLYMIRARSVNNFTGGYQISSSAYVEPQNPVPQISHLSPSSATGTFLGSDFWVAIYGSNFMPESQVRWNGQLRAKFYSSPTLIYIRVLGGDIGWPWPRNAFITVVNPTPGGGTSNSRAFTIRDPFLGESKLLAPESGSSTLVGEKQVFSVEWIAPEETGTWRDMQYMDTRLRDEAGETAAWVRVVEQPGTGSFYRLMNASGEVVDEGAPGEERDLTIPGLVTLHLEESTFSGSGLVAVMSPALTFGPEAVGIYNVEFRVDTKTSSEDEINVQEDVLGTFIVLPSECPVGVTGLTLSGPEQAFTGGTYTFTAFVEPQDSTPPLIYRWAPEPASGQGTATATYTWDSAEEALVFSSVENCGSFMGDLKTVLVATQEEPDLEIKGQAPVMAVPGEPFEYILTLTNNGASTAEGIVINSSLPEGAAYISGGSFNDGLVTWEIEELAGYGQSHQFTFTVSADGDLSSAPITVAAQNGQGAFNELPEIQMVEKLVSLTPLTGAEISDTNNGISITIPGGSVFSDTVLAYVSLNEPTHSFSSPLSYTGYSFRLTGIQNNQIIPNLEMGEVIQISFDLAGLERKQVQLLALDSDGWNSEGISCMIDEDEVRADCEIFAAEMTEYAFFFSENRVYLPLTFGAAVYTSPSARITRITIDGDSYIVEFETTGFQPSVDGLHVHFFFNTVSEENAGVPGSGPWYVYFEGSPFTGYGPDDRPAEADEVCILTANQNHTIIPGSGNCFLLP